MKINVFTERLARLPETNMFCSSKNILTTHSWFEFPAQSWKDLLLE